MLNLKKISLFSIYLALTNMLPGVAVETLFSPDDKPTNRLIKEIDETKSRILAAIYYISDIKIIEALIRAHNRNVEVRIISDGQTSASRYSKVHLLSSNGIPTFIPKPRTTNQMSKGFVRHCLMHDKFAVMDDKVWTGSFNWTVGANFFNYENVVIISDAPDTCKKFYDRYWKIEEACLPYTPLVLTHQADIKSFPATSAHWNEHAITTYPLA